MKFNENNAVNNLRVVSAKMITNVNSGHPGIALGSAPILYSLYAKAMKFDPKDPDYFNRDRFVMSAGHGSSILYATLHMFGFDLSVEDLKNFRQLNSKTPGHPERLVTPGVDCSTGPLGQGVANAVGMAIAQKHLASKYNKPDIKIIDNHIYTLCGEGCLMEGISYEAFCLAGTLNLDNLTVIYDRNKISIEGDTTTSFDINVENYFRSLGFKVYNVKDGNNIKQISAALTRCKKDTCPTVVICDTVIGYGSPVAGQAGSHGSPLTNDQYKELKKNLKIEKTNFDLALEVEPVIMQEDSLKNKIDYAYSNEIKTGIQKILTNKAKILDIERKNIEEYKSKYPDLYNELFSDNSVSTDYIKAFKKFSLDLNASRIMSGVCLNEISNQLPKFIGGCADLASSTKAHIGAKSELNYISKDNFAERNIHFGIREHAMGAICNGISACGINSFASTFMSFSNYMLPAIRMACMDKLPVLYLFSHDSFMVGEDGPTHQSVEQLVSLRSIPGLNVFRPYNPTEMKAAFIYYLENKLPTVIATGKNKVTVESKVEIETVMKGGYIISEESKKCQAIVVATGYEVETALQVQKTLLDDYRIDVRIVSMPNVALFERQTKNYISKIFPAECTKRVVIEPLSKNGWAKIVGKDALFITRDEFGKSAKADDLLIEFKFSVDQIAEAIRDYVKKY